MRKTIVPAVVGLAVSLACAGGLRAQSIVVVDSEKVHRKSREGRKVLGQIDRIKKRKQRTIDRKKKGLKREYDAIMRDAKNLAASKKLLKPSVYKTRQEKLQQRYMKWGGKMQQWQYYAMQEQQKLSSQAAKLLGVFRTKLQAKIEALAQLKGFKLVIDKSAVWYAKNTIDITQQVIKLVDGR